MAKNREKEISEKRLYVAGWMLTVVQMILTVVFAVILHRTALFPVKMEAVADIGLVIVLLIERVLMRRKGTTVQCVVGYMAAVILCTGYIYAGGKLNQLTDTLQTITDVKEETAHMGVYVLDEDAAQSITDTAEYRFGILKEIAREDSDNTVAQIQEELGQKVIKGEYDGVSDLADAVLTGESKAVIMNEDFADMITEIEGYENFSSEVREIASYEWKNVVNSVDSDERKNTVGDDVIFVMYLSGIDTFGAISSKSRSDVNILAVVNSYTHQILLVSTPRDYYVPLSVSNGIKDKLTHAGIYGIDVSIDTLEKLYDMNIDYYFRVNFSGFEALIDALGGITVQSEYSFDVEPSFHYTKGNNEVNGMEALAFARERHAFAEGDRQRGENQMAVITGVIQKLQTPAVLQNFTGLMDGVKGSFETDMPYNVLLKLVRNQLSAGTGWTVKSYTVDGTGSKASTYSISKPVYVMEPDKTTVEEANQMINQVLMGE